MIFEARAPNAGAADQQNPAYAAMTGGVRQRGYALFAVLLTITVLAAIGAALLKFTLSNAISENAEALQTRGKYLALAGIETAAFEIFAGTEISVDQLTKSYDIDGATVVLSISDEAGRIDLNLADPLVISAAFAATGTPIAEADALGAAVVDWRDSDDTPGTLGAEMSDYAGANLTYGPRNGPFETVGELMQVRGMTDHTYACVFPLFTVYSDSANVNFNAALDKVRAVFDWAQANNWGSYNWTIPPPDPAARIQTVRSDNSGSVIRMDIRVIGIAATDVKYQAVIRLSGRANAPYELLSFGRALPDQIPGDCQT